MYGIDRYHQIMLCLQTYVKYSQINLSNNGKENHDSNLCLQKRFWFSIMWYRLLLWRICKVLLLFCSYNLVLLSIIIFHYIWWMYHPFWLNSYLSSGIEGVVRYHLENQVHSCDFLALHCFSIILLVLGIILDHLRKFF